MSPRLYGQVEGAGCEGLPPPATCPYHLGDDVLYFRAIVSIQWDNVCKTSLSAWHVIGIWLVLFFFWKFKKIQLRGKVILSTQFCYLLAL